MKRLCQHLVLGGLLFTTHVLIAAKPSIIRLDGSSTVFPIAEAVAEEFQLDFPKLRVTVGLSGTGGGFKKFLNGEIDVSNASRKITQSEKLKAKKKKVTYLEIPIAFDGLSVVVNRKNDWAKTLTMAQLKQIWEPGSQVKKWSDVNKDWPNKEIKLYGPGPDSGTFDFFTENIVGRFGVSRPDYITSEDDNILVRGIRYDQYALGYFGYAYYAANQKALKVIGIKKGEDASIKPTIASIKDQSYPLSRTLYLYVNLEKARKKEVTQFVTFLLDKSESLTAEIGYIPLKTDQYTRLKKQFLKRVSRTGMASS